MDLAAEPCAQRVHGERLADGRQPGEGILHGGLRLAYRITDRGVLGESEYVDPSGRERGADTIFLLSDGEPTWDD